MKQIVDYKILDMTPEEFEYYKKIINEFTIGTHNGKDQFHDLFDVDEEGYITFIHPPIRKQIAWGVLFFIQNLMINQRLRKIENNISEILINKGNKNE